MRKTTQGKSPINRYRCRNSLVYTSWNQVKVLNFYICLYMCQIIYAKDFILAPLPQVFLRLDSRDLIKISYLGLSVSRSLSFCVMSGCGSWPLSPPAAGRSFHDNDPAWRWVRITLTEDWSLVPSNQVGQVTMACNSFSRESDVHV